MLTFTDKKLKFNNDMHPSVPICFVFIGCASNVVFLELLIK